MNLFKSHRLTVGGIHARFDLRVNPQCRPFLHGAQQERFKVQKHFVVPFAVFGWLVRDNRGKISVPTTAKVKRQIHGITSNHNNVSRLRRRTIL